ncbi:hypothetical protein ACUN7V_11480 [Quadrisphaera oryzae]|uniref:hypothetical protein n=1 Tax=Quadrisphaera TaxID=317661 RepID=UPI00164729C4|nr:hypothetical protein [Quadrisphaera sp. RL12-1S]MBC3764209.1 hypothetical protein [Quadrisphaera sp. RL12-1S]
MTADASLAVSGGVGGYGVLLEDLDVAVTRLQTSAADLQRASADLDWGKSLLQGLDGVLADPGASVALEGDLLAAATELRRVAESTLGLSLVVATCTTGYRTANDANRNRWAALGALAGGLSPAFGLTGLVLTGNLSRWMQAGPGEDEQVSPPSPGTGGSPPRSLAGQGAVLGPPSGPLPHERPLSTDLLPATTAPPQTLPPGVVVRSLQGGLEPAQPPVQQESQVEGLTAIGRLVGPGEEPLIGMLAGALVGSAALASPAVPLLAARTVASGESQGIGSSTRSTVTPVPLPPVVAAAGAPTGVGEALRRVEDTSKAPGSDLHVRVERTRHADGSRSTVVYLPGTEKWMTDSPTPADLDAIQRGVAGKPSAYTDAVLRAMEEAGVRPDEPVLLSGYSLGGITAAQMAADPAVRAHFDVQGLITAGAPIGHVDIPSTVSTISVEHSEDLVPKLDGAPNTSLESNWVTVEGATPGQLGAHGIEGYADLGDDVDASHRPDLVAAREGLAQFFARRGDHTEVTEVATARVGL